MNVWNNEVHIYKYFLSLYGIVFYFYPLVYNMFKLYFYWRIITLQCCALSTIQQHESAVSVHLFPLFEPPSHLPSIPPLSVITENGGELPVLYSCFPLASCLTHGNVYMCQCYPLSSSHLLLHRCVHKSVLYVWVSTPALQIGSSVPFF